MSGWLTAIGGIAAGAGSIIGGSQGSSGNFRASNVEPLLNEEALRRPGEVSSSLNMLNAQSAFGLGVDPDALALDILLRQIESGKDPKLARKWQRRIQGLQAELMRADLEGLNPMRRDRIVEELNTINRNLRAFGGGQLSIGEGGTLTVTLADAGLQGVVDAARAQAATNRENRLRAESELARITGDFPTASASDLAALEGSVRTSQDREINDRFGRESDRILQLANTRGFNPAATLGEMERNRSDALFDSQFTAADRAFQILSGRQGLAQNSISGLSLGLSPDRSLAITNALRGQQTPTTGQLVAAQLGASSAANQASADRQGSGIAGGLGAFGDTLMLLGDYLGNRQTDPNSISAEHDRLNRTRGPGTS